LLAALLSSAGHRIDTGCSTLRPLWAMEAIQRSLNFLKLSLIREARVAALPDEHATTVTALTLATHLASLYQSIANASVRQMVSCSPVLRSLVEDLVALFGPDTGTVGVETDIESITLPAFQWRALILAASDLVMSSLLYSSHERGHGHLTVELYIVAPNLACLTVGDDTNLANRIAGDEGGVADEMAGLLASSVARQHFGPCGTMRKITFPVNI
jgi:two-component sensor histidine kinase